LSLLLGQPASALQVGASIPPQKNFIEKIGGERVSVTVMVQPGHSPETYEPKPTQLVTLSKIDAYFALGVPFENAWLRRLRGANPNLLVVDTSDGVPRLESTTPHEHHDCAHHHETLDPHIWLSPSRVKIQARNICAALTRLDPDFSDTYEENLRRFLAELDDLDREIRAALEPLSNRSLMVFHPAWGYFADDYGLEMITVQVGGQEPSAAELARLIRRAREEQIETLFVQPEFSTRAAEFLARESGSRIVAVSPLAEDWLENLRRMAGELGTRQP
jgi:zinc transport system substrate-binding protein